MRLMEALKNIKEEHLISFHMPGHKNGRLLFHEDASLMAYDITEIPGADHLHDSETCIRETEEAIAKTYGALKSRMLVGGSTVGILSMILGCTSYGDRILVNRNAHKSVYNAIEMNGLTPVYLYPRIDNYLGIPIGFDFSEDMLDLDHTMDEISPNFSDEFFQNIKICVLTYPTYEGLCYTIEEMIDKCHKHGIPVLVDEAHGAHLLLHENGPKSSLELGADIVVQSFHKTLPAMTQTGCLHVSKTHRVSESQLDKLDWYLKSLQTSSPSYVLMASMDQMLTIVQTEGVQSSKVLEQHIEQFYESVLSLKHIEMVQLEPMDITKMIIAIPKTSYKSGVWDGFVLSHKLRTEYGIQCEYDSSTMVLMMTSFCNTAEDFAALSLALHKLDAQRVTEGSTYKNAIENEAIVFESTDYESVYRALSNQSNLVMKATDATKLNWEMVSLEEAIGNISAEYVIPYPPGIPVVVPGERILKETLVLFPKSKDKIKIIK